MSEKAPIAAVGVACFRGDDVLLIRRGAPPMENRWSLPGGRVEWGERTGETALRELLEETGCRAELVGLVDVVDAILTRRGDESDPSGRDPWGHYVLIDYAARWVSGEPRAGDDARDARFFSLAEVEGLGLWEETLRIIAAARRML